MPHPVGVERRWAGYMFLFLVHVHTPACVPIIQLNRSCGCVSRQQDPERNVYEVTLLCRMYMMPAHSSLKVFLAFQMMCNAHTSTAYVRDAVYNQPTVLSAISAHNCVLSYFRSALSFCDCGVAIVL